MKFIRSGTRFRCWERMRCAAGSGWWPRSTPARTNAVSWYFPALVRARFCELLSPSVGHGDSDLFLMGLLSLMDAILEIPMARVLENVPVDQESKAVLLGGPSRLRPFYQLMIAQESGQWEAAHELAGQLHLSESEVAEKYWEAMQWARQVSGG